MTMLAVMKWFGNNDLFWALVSVMVFMVKMLSKVILGPPFYWAISSRVASRFLCHGNGEFDSLYPSFVSFLSTFPKIKLFFWDIKKRLSFGGHSTSRALFSLREKSNF